MNDHHPTKKSPSLVLTNNAREQVTLHQLTKKMVLDIMKTPTDRIKLADGQFQFTGNDEDCNIYITVGFVPEKEQWVISNIDVIAIEPEPQPVFIEETPPPAIVFTNHAKQVLNREFLDHRTIEHLMRNPDKEQDEDDEKVRFIGWADGDKIHVIAKFLPDENKWLVITVEVRYQHDPNPSADIFEFDGEPTDEHPGITFTTHALERMKLRNIYRYEVKETILNPEKTFEEEDDKVKFISKEFSLNRSYHVVGRFLPDENKWLVISPWIRGEEDDGSLSTWQPEYQKTTSDGLPRIALTKNVRQRMKEEGIERSHIEDAIRSPQGTSREKGGKLVFTGEANGKTIYVVCKYLPNENKWLVITTYTNADESNFAYIILIGLLGIIVVVAGFILFTNFLG